MVRILAIVAVLSLMIAPLVFSEDEGEAPPPSSEDTRSDLVSEHLEQLFSNRQQQTFLVVPDVPRARATWTCLAHPGSSSAREACEVGRELSRMPPCTRPEDCQAYHLWTESVGPPSVRRALPPAEELDRFGVVAGDVEDDPR